MKKFRYSLMLLSVLFILTGCGCEHEWVEATCVTAKTCSLCGKTDGEIPGHSYGRWSRSHEILKHMSRSCSSCGETESREVDEEILLQDARAAVEEFFVGKWTGMYVLNGGTSLDLERGEAVAEFHPDGTFTIQSPSLELDLSGQWEPVKNENTYEYTCTLKTEEGSAGKFRFNGSWYIDQSHPQVDWNIYSQGELYIFIWAKNVSD